MLSEAKHLGCEGNWRPFLLPAQILRCAQDDKVRQGRVRVPRDAGPTKLSRTRVQRKSVPEPGIPLDVGVKRGYVSVFSECGEGTARPRLRMAANGG